MGILYTHGQRSTIKTYTQIFKAMQYAHTHQRGCSGSIIKENRRLGSRTSMPRSWRGGWSMRRPFTFPLCVYVTFRMLCSVVILRARGSGVRRIAGVSEEGRVSGSGVIGVVRVGCSVSVLWGDRFTVVCDRVLQLLITLFNTATLRKGRQCAWFISCGLGMAFV